MEKENKADFSWLSEREQEALAEMAKKKEMSEQGLMRMALRTFQLIDSGGAKLEFINPPDKIMCGCGGD